MTVQKIAEDIECEMPIEGVARLFASCLARLAADGREAFDAFKVEADKLDNHDRGEVEGWMAEMFPEEE